MPNTRQGNAVRLEFEPTSLAHLNLSGAAFTSDWMWAAGDESAGIERLQRLAKLALDGNRRLLACVPIETDAGGTPTLVREAADGRRALRLKGDAQHNQLTRLLEDDPHVGPFLAIPGKDSIDNNAQENAIRPFCLGRRNWLFADTVAGANASANLYSLLQTCQVVGIDGYRYLRALLIALPKAQTVDDYAGLLPWRIDLSAI